MTSQVVKRRLGLRSRREAFKEQLIDVAIAIVGGVLWITVIAIVYYII